MGADQTSAVKENFNLSYESSKVDETSVIELKFVSWVFCLFTFNAWL